MTVSLYLSVTNHLTIVVFAKSDLLLRHENLRCFWRVHSLLAFDLLSVIFVVQI